MVAPDYHEEDGRTETLSHFYNLRSTPDRIAALGDQVGSQGDGFGRAVAGGGVAGSAIVGGRVSGSGGGVAGSTVGVAGSGVAANGQQRERGGRGSLRL